YEGLGDVSEMTGEHEKAREAFKRGLSSVADSDSLSRARLYRKIGKTWEPQREYAQALQAYEQAEVSLGDVHDPADHQWWQEWVQIQLVRMWVLHWRGQWQELTARSDKIQSAVQEHGTPAQRSQRLPG